MKSKKIFQIIFVTSMIIVLGFAVSPTTANSPEDLVYPFDNTYSVENPCHYKITSHDVGTGYATMWYDENGVPYKVHQRWVGTETWSAHGKSLEFTYNYPDRAWVDPAYPDGYILYIGATMLTMPHEGVVYSATGLEYYSFTIDEGGNFVLLEELKQVGNWETDWDFICEYFRN